MIKPAVSDVVCPSVSAKYPNALSYQVVSNTAQHLGFRIIRFSECLFQSGNSLTLFIDSRLRGLIGIHDILNQSLIYMTVHILKHFTCLFSLFVDREPETEAKFCIIFKK